MPLWAGGGENTGRRESNAASSGRDEGRALQRLAAADRLHMATRPTTD